MESVSGGSPSRVGWEMSATIPFKRLILRAVLRVGSGNGNLRTLVRREIGKE